MTEYTLKEVADLTQSKAVGDPSHIVRGVADLESASSEDISFLSNPRYEKAMLSSKAGAVFVSPEQTVPSGRNFLLHANPSEAFQRIIKVFYGENISWTGFDKVHSTAVVHPSATLGKNVSLGPHAVIDKGAKIGDNTTISSGCYIGPETTIGSDCLLHPHVTIRERCVIGNRVTLQPGVVIGSCGFGYIQNKSGHHTKLEQLGYVEIGDDVEIGANTTIDRARFKKTLIGRGTKIDNLVQIAHGVEIGEHSLVIAQTGIAGSTSVGNHVILAGQVAVAGHLKIADGVMVAGCSGISKSIPRAGKYGGVPALPLAEYNRNAVQLRNIGSLIEKVNDIEHRLDKAKE